MIYGWERYIFIEEGFLKARQYVSFDIEDAYSDFFSTSVILLGVEIEANFKRICKAITGNELGNMEKYKKVILKNFPNICSLSSMLREDTKRKYYPFKDWKNERLVWWDAYVHVKHSITDKQATLNVALNMLSAYQLLLFVAEACTGIDNEHKYAYSHMNSPRLLTPNIFQGITLRPGDNTLYASFSTIELKKKLKALPAQKEA